MTEWFERDEFWVTMFPYMFPPKKIAAAAPEVRQVLRLVGRRRGAVLDLCCGPGRHAVEFARRGFRVTGVDRTRFLLNKARQRARAARVKVEWLEVDMREFVRPAAFDLVLSLFTSFGYFDNKDDDRRVLRNIFESLTPKGAVVMDMAGRERLAKVFQPGTAARQPDGAVLVELHEIYDDWSRIRNEWILIKGRKARSFKFHHSVYSGQELKDLLLETGFAEVKLFGNLDSQPYGPDAMRLVAVAHKGR
jgi:SAM-dependent methyltransferase